MPIENKHEQYTNNFEKWRKCRLVCEGEEAVKAAGADVLPMLRGVSEGEWEAYVMRAEFFAATARTLEVMLGMVFKIPPKLTVPKRWEEELSNSISKDKKSFEVFSKQVVKEVLTTARYGVMVDMPEQELAAPSPYLAGFCAEAIWNWSTREVDGKEEFDLIVLHDMVQAREDRFDTTRKERLRALILEWNNETGKEEYRVETYRKKTEEEKRIAGEDKSDWILESTVVPKVRGQSMEHLPFVIFGVNDLHPDTEKPPLLDIANVNLSHFRSSADLEHGRHYTALPTPWAAGFSAGNGKDKETLQLGSSVVWTSEDPNAKAGFLEFTGQGLSALVTAKQEKKDEMAVLGASLLSGDKNVGEAADTLRVKKSGETNVLASVTGTVAEGLARCIDWLLLIRGSLEGGDVDFNQEFNDFQLTAPMLTSLMGLVQGNLMSREVFYFNLSRAGVYPDGHTAEQEADLIEVQKGDAMNDMIAQQQALTDLSDEEDVKSETDGGGKDVGAAQEKTAV